MHQSVRIYVEGEEDEYFLKSYVDYLNCRKTGSDIIYKDVRGWTNLRGQCPNIKRYINNGERILIVFDADEDYEERMSEIEEIIQDGTQGEINSQNSNLNIFLFPNNQLPGEIEDLLEKIAIQEHKKVFDCFDGYKECLNGKGTSYQLPDIKAKIYCYKHALGIQKKEKKDHFKPEYWDFQNAFLIPLERFLLKSLS